MECKRSGGMEGEAPAEPFRSGPEWLQPSEGFKPSVAFVEPLKDRTMRKSANQDA